MVLKFGRLCILSMGSVGFTPTMACSVAMVYFAILACFLQYCVGNLLPAPILESPALIHRILRSNGGGYMLSMSGFQRSTVCGDNIRRSLCQSSCSAVITDDLEVCKSLFHNQQLFVITLLINLCAEGSVY